VVKPDNEERRVAMFKDNKLRLLMGLVGFTRLGADNDPEASWIIPSALKSSDLLEAIDLIRKFEFDPPAYEDGKTAQDFLRRKAAAARSSARRVNFDDDTDGIDDGSEEDRGEYAADGPTARKSSAKKILKRRRRRMTPQELDDEEKDRRAEERRQKELEKQRKVKSTMFVHDSDDEEDAERDEEFFLREQALRESTNAQFKRTLTLGSTEPASSRKRKGDGQTRKEKKRRKTPPKQKSLPFDTDGSDAEEDDANTSSRGSSQEAESILGIESGEEATDTPLSSQHVATATGPPDSQTTTTKAQDAVMVDVDDEDEEDAVPTVRRLAARALRAGFIIDSDSE
jgi:replication fork protection complex subunit Tof1/Swi1